MFDYDKLLEDFIGTFCEILIIQEGDNVKEISLNDTVYDTVTKYPEIREIIAGLGFAPLRDDRMLQTAGRMMTLGRAAKQFGLSYSTISQVLAAHGFTIKEKEL